MRVLTGALGLTGGMALAAAAQAAPAIAPAARALRWSFEPAIGLPILLTTLWYLAGFVRIRRVPGLRRSFTMRQAAAFLAGELTLVLALLSPLDSMADQLFSAHMGQHMLLLLIAAPLLVWGRPAMLFLWAFGPRGRIRVGRIWATLGLSAGMAGLMRPLIAWALFCGVFIFWHFPGPYQLALHHEGVHTLEHVSFLATALMFWSIVIEPSGRRRLGYGATLLYILTAAILSSLPGAIITLAGTPLYPDYVRGTAAWGLTLLEDQQLAGLLMWIPGGVVYLIAAGSAFLHWLELDDARHTGRYRRDRDRDRGAQRPRLAQPGSRAVIALLCCLSCALLLGGCGSSASASVSGIGDPQRGIAVMRAAGCGACHVVPGVNDATGTVGPPLTQMGRRVFIAGMLRNTPDNLVLWLRHPQAIIPGNAMPDMGLSERDASDVAAYLFTLQ